MGSPTRRAWLRLGLEAIVLVIALFAAFLLRFDGMVPAPFVQQFLVVAPLVVAVELLSLRLSGLERQSWQYTRLGDLLDLALPIGLVATGLLLIRLVAGTVGPPGLGWMSLPLGVVMMNLLLALLGLATLRVARRVQSEHAERRGRDRGLGAPPARRVVLVGSGRAGVAMAEELRQRPHLGMVAIGFVDDRVKVGRSVAGLEVLGSVDDLELVARRHALDAAVITLATAGRHQIQRIVERCEHAGIASQIVPAAHEIVSGAVVVSSVRDVDITDLLGRPPVRLDDVPTRRLVRGRCVLVTGAGGSIGAELVRQLARLGPRRLLLVDRAEPALWATHRELVGAHPGLSVRALIADVGDRVRMASVFADFHPDVVVHAAAHKHVPMMEDNPGEAIKNNVGGTKVVVDLAATSGVERFVLVSTDKAVNPTSVMGATKRVAELYVQHVAAESGLAAVSVRFGNVLGSTGSVVPIFTDQVAAGGPVTVTHPDMKRYFMTIPEASQLVLVAAAIGRPGEVLVLDMGEPVRILDLAEAVIRLSGLEPHRDVPIEFTGIRPGEKLFEELSLASEDVTRTRHPRIWVGVGPSSPHVPGLGAVVADLVDAADHVRSRELVHRLWHVVSTDARPGAVRDRTGPPVGVAAGPGRPDRLARPA